jgi:Phenazine biosynthesis-like protein
MRPLSYVLCDVFTDRPLTGNALAVFTDASELSDAQMQALAREMNLSESSFVVPPSVDADAGVRMRFAGVAEGAGFGWMTQPLPKREPFAQVPELFTALGVGYASLPVELSSCAGASSPTSAAGPRGGKCTRSAHRSRQVALGR